MAKPRDRREYVRFSVTMPDHPKLASIDSPNAGWLYAVGICWAGEHLTDGFVTPRVVERKANVAARWTKALVSVGLWHAPGHGCPKCPQPPAGQVVIHDFLEHQRSRSEADAARDAARIAAEKRWGKSPPGPPKADAERIAESNADRIPEGNAEAMQRQRERESSYLLTLISRLAAGDVGPPPAEVIDGWQELAGPGVDLEDQAMAYLARYGDRPARDERAAWLGWLRMAREHAATSGDAAPTPPGCPECIRGWIPDEYGHPSERRCPTCKPRLEPVADIA